MVKLYGRRFTIEETFRDQKDRRFGLGLSATHVGTPERRDRLLLLAAIAQALLTLLGAAGATTNRHAMCARALLLRLDHLEAQGFWSQSRARDNGMAQMAQELLALDPRSRATLWAHLGHLSREYVVGAPTMGEHLTRALGAGYRVYALLAYDGAARAREGNPNGRMISPALGAAPAYSLEGVLARSRPGPVGDITYWDFDAAEGAARAWLHRLHWVRSFGAVYRSEKFLFEVYDIALLDGAVLFKRVGPTEAIDEGAERVPTSSSPPASQP